MFFGQGKAWKLDGWSSDAEFLYWGRAGDAPIHTLICCNATYVDIGEQRIVSAKRPVLRCEIVGGERFEVNSNDQESVVVDNEAWKSVVSGSPQLAGKLS